MILNLLRVEALKVEQMIKRSFSEHATQALLPETLRKIQEGERELGGLAALTCDVCEGGAIKNYWQTAKEAYRTATHVVEKGAELGKILTSGRVVILYDEV